MKQVFLTALVLTALLVQASTGQSLSTVAVRPDAIYGATCENIFMPGGLCPNCRMLPFSDTGRFPNQRYIYDLDDPICQAGLRKYSQLNPCDAPRAAQTGDFSNETNRLRLGVFMYSVCETCCDCIPIGSRVGEYDERRAARNLTRITRGNCPVHVHYDTCRMWPRVRNIARPGGATHGDRPMVCPLLAQWYRTPASEGWGRNPKITGIDWRIKRVLWQLTTFGRCEDRRMWKECAALEVAQRRV